MLLPNLNTGFDKNRGMISKRGIPPPEKVPSETVLQEPSARGSNFKEISKCLSVRRREVLPRTPGKAAAAPREPGRAGAAGGGSGAAHAALSAPRPPSEAAPAAAPRPSGRRRPGQVARPRGHLPEPGLLSVSPAKAPPAASAALGRSLRAGARCPPRRGGAVPPPPPPGEPGKACACGVAPSGGAASPGRAARRPQHPGAPCPCRRRRRGSSSPPPARERAPLHSPAASCSSGGGGGGAERVARALPDVARSDDDEEETPLPAGAGRAGGRRLRGERRTVPLPGLALRVLLLHEPAAPAHRLPAPHRDGRLPSSARRLLRLRAGKRRPPGPGPAPSPGSRASPLPPPGIASPAAPLASAHPALSVEPAGRGGTGRDGTGRPRAGAAAPAAESWWREAPRWRRGPGNPRPNFAARYSEATPEQRPHG